MRLSEFYLPTLHQSPGEAVEASHRLLLRAGLLRPLGGGSFAYLPLGQLVRQRVRAIASRCMELYGGFEVALPPLLPTAPWEEAGLRPVGLSLRDRAGRPFLLPATVEPLLTALLRPDLRSHRSLPLLLYGFRHRFREEAPAGPGPLSARQSMVLEAWTLQPDGAALREGFSRLRQACRRVLEHCGLGEGLLDALAGDGEETRELILPAVPGEEPFFCCPQCGYVAAAHAARRHKEAAPPEEPLPLQEVLTPGCHTIADLAAFLGVAESRTAKAVFLVADDRFVFAVVRGDMDVDEDKLARLLGVDAFRPAQEHEIAALGASPGFASPIGIRRSAPQVGLRQVLVVVDDLVARSPNLVAGANKEDYHLYNVNCGRDYSADLVADIVAVRHGDPCPACRAPLEAFASTVLARIWSPGARYSEALGATFQDAAGRECPLYLGCAQIDLDRLLAAAVEVHHDEAGIRWPVDLAPYAVHLLTIGNAPEVLEAGAWLEESLQAAGFPVLYDDRDQSAGSKFVEADLLGMPLRVAVSKRSLAQGSAEVKRRDQPREAVQIVPLDRVCDWIRDALCALRQGKRERRAESRELRAERGCHA